MEEVVAVEEEVVIVGAGIAGLATAVALRRVGIRSLVLERSEGLRATGAALTLFPNAWAALDALGVAHKLTSVYPITNMGYITDVANGTIREIPLTGTHKNGIGPRAVHRKALMEALLEELPNETIRYSSKLTSIEAREEEGLSVVTIRIEDGTTIKAKVLIGCDGVHSGVARWLGLGAPVHSGRSAVRGLAVYPEGHGLKQEVHQFVDAGKRGGFARLNDTDVYWFLVVNSTSKEEELIGNPELIQQEVLENYAKDYPQTYLDVVRHSVLSTITWAPLMFRLPWNVVLGNMCSGTVTVAGDAMHPMTPDLGQGGCSALEDSVVLGRHIGESFLRNREIVPIEMKKAMERYVKERRWHVARVITGSYLSGWVQQGGSAWWMKFLRDVVFYGFLYRWLFGNIRYDCGKLPELESRTKSD